MRQIRIWAFCYDPEWFLTWAQNVTWRSHNNNCMRINDEELEGSKFGLDIRKKGCQTLAQAAQGSGGAISLKGSKHIWIWYSGTWVSGGHCRGGVVIGLDGLRGVFQLKGISNWNLLEICLKKASTSRTYGLVLIQRGRTALQDKIKRICYEARVKKY